MIHHVELWVPSLAEAARSWGWLLGELGYEVYQDWPGGRSWKAGGAYIVFEESPAMLPGGHDRMRAGLNHLALHAGTQSDVDRLTAEAPAHGWELLFADRHPHAGGPEHYAAYLTDQQGFEVELVAGTP
ncbi:VOC family protein [Longispora albida]|uniref:VOC family protein n=1 Tax=Longispora albida TaxID=203523 RepID=UPI000377216F|nr:VOC family protein [Longispora albida]